MRTILPAARVRTFTVLAAGALTLGCGGDEPDAYGNFEAEEVTVSAEVDGRLLRFDVREGEAVEAGVSAGLIDTLPTVLQLRELAARLVASNSATGQTRTEVSAIITELETARRDLARVERLYADSAATERQFDDARTRVAVLEDRLQGARRATEGSEGQGAVVEAQIAQLEDRLNRSRIMNPTSGTVLDTYARAGEFVRPGQPLYQVAALDTLTLRVYVDGGQLPAVGLGDAADVHVDDGAGGIRTLAGTVRWIASEAEFTPTPIQTREERTDLVYAVELRVPNPDGRLKIGMPADVTFAARPATP